MLICGVHGVGKSTLCEKIYKKFSIPYFSASDLIKEFDSTLIQSDKFVNNLDYNQQILIQAIRKKLNKHSFFILDGHTTLLTPKGIKKIPLNVFEAINLDLIIALSSSVNIIIERRKRRDKEDIEISFIEKHQILEVEYAQEIAKAQEVLYKQFEDPTLATLQMTITNWLKGEKGHER